MNRTTVSNKGFQIIAVPFMGRRNQETGLASAKIRNKFLKAISPHPPSTLKRFHVINNKFCHLFLLGNGKCFAVIYPVALGVK